MVLALLLIVTLGKAVPISILARLDGQRPSSALRAGALVGQSGEFSFVLASTGLALGAVRPDSFSLAMGAVVISIVTAEPLLAVAKRLGDALEARATSPEVPDEGLADGLRRHAVILGYGRVGHAVARVLGSRGFAWVAVEGDFHVAREARQAGAPVIFGEAGMSSILDRARVADAHAMVVAIPDALATRQAVAYALGRNPRLEVVARAHSDAEEADLRRLGAARVVVAERELGNELIRHALRRFGVSDREVAAIVEARRRAVSDPFLGGDVRVRVVLDDRPSRMRMMRSRRPPTRVVGDDDGGLAALPVEAPQERKHLGRARRVEVAGRLVGEEQGRLVHQRPREGDALLLAAGELHRPMVRALGQADHVERLQRRALAPCAPLHARVVGGEQHVLRARSASGPG